ncbi:MAG: iron complex outerrane recepter protein, partial [Gammaproteobacteria bacterium]|nr:iron complex outerrane recepter protein [Gammaproteobacteria bacterium]
MLSRHARRGVSIVAVPAALLASSSGVFAESSERALPAVTVDAPATVKPKQRKPVAQTAGASRSSAKRVAERAAPVAATNDQGAGSARASLDPPAAVARYQLPQRSFSITAKEADETINLKDPEDAVKYMPSLFVRKRNDGDNQAVLATRSWGLNSSARTLIY